MYRYFNHTMIISVAAEWLHVKFHSPTLSYFSPLGQNACINMQYAVHACVYSVMDIVTGAWEGMNKIPVFCGHCSIAEWTKGLFSTCTLLLDLPYFIELIFYTFTQTLHICQVLGGHMCYWDNHKCLAFKNVMYTVNLHVSTIIY